MPAPASSGQWTVAGQAKKGDMLLPEGGRRDRRRAHSGFMGPPQVLCSSLARQGRRVVADWGGETETSEPNNLNISPSCLSFFPLQAAPPSLPVIVHTHLCFQDGVGLTEHLFFGDQERIFPVGPNWLKYCGFSLFSHNIVQAQLG